MARPIMATALVTLMTCRYCDKLIEGPSTKTFSYWSKVEFACHPECKEAGERAEALECQTIDADCNDCRYFQRIRTAAKLHEFSMSEEGEWVEITHQPQYAEGHCFRFNQPALAQPNKWSGIICFEHRRAP